MNDVPKRFVAKNVSGNTRNVKVELKEEVRRRRGISLLEAPSHVNNCQEHMGHVELLREREGASANGFCVPVRECVCVQRTSTTVIGRW